MVKSPQPNPWRYMGLGVELIGAVVILTLLGRWIDRRFQTDPWFTLAGALIGIVGGLYNLIKLALRTKP